MKRKLCNLSPSSKPKEVNMPKKLFKLILPAVLLLSTLTPTLAPQLSYAAKKTEKAEPTADICENNEIPDTVRAANGCDGSSDELPNTVITIINSVIAVLGLVAVVFIIIGGISYMTSSGETAKVEKAKKTILYAVIGLAICVLAFAIANFAISIINSQPAVPET